METILAKDEVLIKQYDYASAGSKKDAVMHSVIITDRRIISQEIGERTFVRDEMPLDHADYIATDFDSYKKDFGLTMIMFALSVILVVGGVVWSRFTDAYWFLIPTVLGIVTFVLGVVAMVVALKTRGASAQLEIRSRQPVYEMLSFSANGVKPNNKIEKLKIKVDKDVAERMLNEIGALILDYKNKDVK